MKTIKTLLLAIVMVAGMSLPAAAQFRFGVRAGVAVNDLHLDMKTFDGDNRAGFTEVLWLNLLCLLLVSVLMPL